ncbi:SGNH/GDSL hydrolase family protein [Nocardia asteroides]|uniref:SGNH/GDSL hydrolase family protein n=1 Tax=Nocardia asteroides TaxID=1824 RepID=UPI0034287F91
MALGDSQTEGVGDGDDIAGVRGLADRLAEMLAAANPDVEYANLAVRGKLAAQVREEQLDAARAMRPDIATVIAGVNDVLRPRFDVEEVGRHLDAMFASLTVDGATVVTVTFPDLSRLVPIARLVAGRIDVLNERIRQSAARYGVLVAETGEHSVVTDPRLWTPDRLHASPLGHQRIAEALAHALQLPGSSDSWTMPIEPPLGRRSVLAGAGTELRWLGTFLAPWLRRRLAGRSSADGRTAKRPHLAAVDIGSSQPNSRR